MVRFGRTVDGIDLEYKDSVRYHRRDRTRPVAPEVEVPAGSLASSLTSVNLARSRSRESSTRSAAPPDVVNDEPGHPVELQHSNSESAQSHTQSHSNDKDEVFSFAHHSEPKTPTFANRLYSCLRQPSVLCVLAIVLIVCIVVTGLCGDGNCKGPPSDLPTVRDTSVESYLRQISLLSADGINDTDLVDAENMAIRFLLNASDNDIVQNSLQQFHLRQQFALLNLYFAAQNDVISWNNSTGWLTESDECTWQGISCRPQDFTKGQPNTTLEDFSVLGTEWVIHSIQLPENSMNGRLSPNVCLLNYLSHLNISHNRIFGSFPSGMLHCRSMVEFIVHDNELSGTLPESTGASWPSLEEFDVGNNNLFGSLPSTIGLLNHLREFSISGNDFTGTIPSTISNWTNLQVARFDGNPRLMGSLPNEFCTLNELYVLTSDTYCPCCIQSYLRTVAASGGNSSSQTMEAEIAAMHWLIYNDTWQWNPGDAVDAFRLRQRYALLTLYFATQNATDMWHDANGWLDELDECMWYGISCTSRDLGDGLGNQTVVTWIGLIGNGLRGKISPDLSMLNNLEYLNLSHNNLTGMLPSVFENLKSLTSFVVWDNHLVGTIPESYGNWDILTRFDIESNSISGSIPVTLVNWQYLEYFFVSDNLMNGTIPEDFVNSISHMIYFNVSFNSLSGRIPDSMYDWPNAAEVDFSSNEVSGTMPLGLCNLVNVTSAKLYADTPDEVTCDCCVPV